MDTVIQKSYYFFLEKFVKEHWDMLKQRRVYIFGAGPRGLNLLQLLRMFQISDLFFVDNNPQKQGKQIDGCYILSFPEASIYVGPHCFLCPVEGGQQILAQLALAGYQENMDYFNLDVQFTDYSSLLEEVKRPLDTYSIEFGCCISAANILGNKLVSSFGERLKESLLGGDICRCCVLPGLGPSMYYHIINAIVSLHGAPPRFIFCLLEVALFAWNHPMFLGKMVYSQHKLFLEELIRISPQNDELLTYYQQISNRLKYSMNANNPSKSFNIKKALQTVYRLKYNYNLDDINEANESILYLQKMLKMTNQNNIPVVLFFAPVDYLMGERILGQGFTEHYASSVKKIKSMLKGYSFSCIDASFIATSDCFVQYSDYNPDINPFLNEKGQNIVLDFLRHQKALQNLLDLN